MAREYSELIGVRFTQADVAKLQRLCDATQRPVSEMIRHLVRMAEPTGLPDVLIHTANTAYEQG